MFVSVDSARGGTDEDGGAIDPSRVRRRRRASQAEHESGTAWEGLRIVSIANPAKPVQLAAVKTDCGSHTHTLVPDEAHNRLIAYVLSYPLGAPDADLQPRVAPQDLDRRDPADRPGPGQGDRHRGRLAEHRLPRRQRVPGAQDRRRRLHQRVADLGHLRSGQAEGDRPHPEPEQQHPPLRGFSWDGNTLSSATSSAAPRRRRAASADDTDRLGGHLVLRRHRPGEAGGEGLLQGPAAGRLRAVHRAPVQRRAAAQRQGHPRRELVPRPARRSSTSPTRRSPKQIAYYIPQDPTSSPDDDPDAEHVVGLLVQRPRLREQPRRPRARRLQRQATPTSARRSRWTTSTRRSRSRCRRRRPPRGRARRSGCRRAPRSARAARASPCA